VSIVTPSYNQAQFLNDTIVSVLKQDYPNIEYFIIDGASSDGSIDVIKIYKNQLAYWESEPDRGQCHAINKGFSRSQGEIIAWLNSDDIYKPGAVEQVVDVFRKHPNAIAVVGACDLVNAQREKIGCKQPVGFETDRLLRGGVVPGQPAVFMKREIFEQHGGLREDLHYVLDWEYWLRISIAYSPDQIVLLDHVLAEARIWTGNKTSIGRGEDGIGESSLNASERRKVLDDLFDSPELPTDIRKWTHVAYSHTYWHQARMELRAGNLQSARKHFVKAYKLAPKEYQKGDFIASIGGTFLGYSMSKKIKNIYLGLSYKSG